MSVSFEMSYADVIYKIYYMQTAHT